MNPELELRLHRFLGRLWTKLKPSRDADQAARSALRETVDFFEAQAGCLAEVPPGESEAVVSFGIPAEEPWDLGLLTAFYRHERPAIPDDHQLAPVTRRQRMWRVLALRRAGGPAPKQERQALARIATTLSELIHQIDYERLRDVRSRIERKIMEELRPKDLFYQILHGLRTLTGYDHSSALLVPGAQRDTLVLLAEQIAWRKGKSEAIGLRLPIDTELHELMNRGKVYGFDREGDTWHDWTERGATALATLLDFNRDSDQRESSMLCAPLATKDGILGVLKVASRHSGSLGLDEAETVRRFMAQAAVAIQNSRRTETLEARMLEAEKKNAMADLARSVAHDVNNALGSILPLVQQIRDDARAGCVDTKVLGGDMDEIERSLQVCMRIFGGMLNFARTAHRGSGHANVRRALGGAMAILREGMRRRSISFEPEVPEDLPTLRGNESDLEQVLLNLLANARDAMPNGGSLTVAARAVDGGVEIRITDTGQGIAKEHLALIQEPFYSTKPQGNGLGLSICRSIVWSMQGKMEIASRKGEGATVTLLLPALGSQPAKSEP